MKVATPTMPSAPRKPVAPSLVPGAGVKRTSPVKLVAPKAPSAPIKPAVAQPAAGIAPPPAKGCPPEKIKAVENGGQVCR
jgi:hypothetical protein